MKRKIRFAVDFDGTIVENRFPKTGPFMPRAKEALLRMKEAGHELILWTCREHDELAKAVSTLREAGIHPNYVNQCPERHKGFAERKVDATYYLDDKAWPPFPGWPAWIEWAEKNGIIK